MPSRIPSSCRPLTYYPVSYPVYSSSFQVTFQDLAIGTLPQCLIECIQEIHIAVNPALYPSREASSRIQDDVLQICNLIKKDAAEYWKERCRITIEWEERNGITKKNKRKVLRVLEPDETIKRKRVTRSTKLQLPEE
jgi:hypothetical protein